MAQNSDLVYSTDPELNRQCSRCKNLLTSCKCSKSTNSIDPSKIKAVLRLEKKHRRGKNVSVIEQLPPSEEFLKKLSGELKKNCGCGGTYKIIENTGIIEIQGDKLIQIKSELEKQGIKCR